jgi:hypothetical protein
VTSRTTPRLAVDADGWLKFSNIPPQALGADGPLDWDKPLESSGGSWQLVKDPFGEGDPWFWITMNRAPDDRITTQLFVHGLEPDIELWRYWNGESDPPIRFERVGDDD